MPPSIDDLKNRYAKLRLAVVGDFCLDRYLDIDPDRREVSIETGLDVHNVVRVRAQPGAAGTIVNNLVALGAGAIHVVGVIGDDGEGFELRRALGRMPGVRTDALFSSPEFRTFTYCKPMLSPKDGPPVELNRLDSKNWSPMPGFAEDDLVRAIGRLDVDAVVVMDQVDGEQHGVVTPRVREAARRIGKLALADSRRGLRDFPPMLFKMNAAELSRFFPDAAATDKDAIARLAATLAGRNRQPVVVTLSERGILAAEPGGAVHHAPAHPVRGPIDIVGAGDCVTANLVTALASGVPMPDALRLAMAAASIVIHQLGTTGVATLDQIGRVVERMGGTP